MMRAKLVSVICCFLVLGTLFAFSIFPPTTTILVYFIGGWLLGLLLLVIDELDLVSSLMQKLVPAEVLDADSDSGEINSHLFTRSIVFLLLLPFIILYILTTTKSIIGYSALLAVLTTIAAEMTILRTDLVAFRERFLWQLKRTITIDEQQVIVVVAWSLFLGTVFVGSI